MVLGICGSHGSGRNRRFSPDFWLEVNFQPFCSFAERQNLKVDAAALPGPRASERGGAGALGVGRFVVGRLLMFFFFSFFVFGVGSPI